MAWWIYIIALNSQDRQSTVDNNIPTYSCHSHFQVDHLALVRFFIFLLLLFFFNPNTRTIKATNIHNLFCGYATVRIIYLSRDHTCTEKKKLAIDELLTQQLPWMRLNLDHTFDFSNVLVRFFFFNSFIYLWCIIFFFYLLIYLFNYVLFSFFFFSFLYERLHVLRDGKGYRIGTWIVQYTTY